MKNSFFNDLNVLKIAKKQTTTCQQPKPPVYCTDDNHPSSSGICESLTIAEHEHNDEYEDDAFSDHVGLFDSRNDNIDSCLFNESSEVVSNSSSTKLNYELNMRNYYLTNIMNTDMSVNNWSMYESQCNRDDAQTHTSWGKLKQSKSNLAIMSKSTSRAFKSVKPSSSNRITRTTTEPCISELTLDTNKVEPKKELTQSRVLINAHNLYSNFSSFQSTTSSNDCNEQRSLTTFSKVKHRSMQSQKPVSIGTQYPPHVIDQSMQTSVIAQKHPKKRLRIVNKTLPDLAFLKEYNDVKSNEIKGLMTNSIQAIDKRKTLKSIKRYRQTKQNTEPCADVPPASSTNTMNPMSSSSSSSSGYISADILLLAKKNYSKSNESPSSCSKRKKLSAVDNLYSDTPTMPSPKPLNALYLLNIGWLFTYDLNAVNKRKHKTNKKFDKKKHLNLHKSKSSEQLKHILSSPKSNSTHISLKYDNLIWMLNKKAPNKTGVAHATANTASTDSDLMSTSSMNECPPTAFEFDRQAEFDSDQVKLVKITTPDKPDASKFDPYVYELKAAILKLEKISQKEQVFWPFIILFRL